MSDTSSTKIAMRIHETVVDVAIAFYAAIMLLLITIYDGNVIAITSSSILIVCYIASRQRWPSSRVYQYTSSTTLAGLSVTLIIQSGQLPVMHSLLGIASVVLIVFRRGSIYLPLMAVSLIFYATTIGGDLSAGSETITSFWTDSTFWQAMVTLGIQGISAWLAHKLGQSAAQEFREKQSLLVKAASIDRNIAFAEAMSAGNLQAEYTFAEGESDELSRSLKTLQTNLLASNEREKEEKFVTVGITRISDIIRRSSDDAEKLADEFIQEIVKYTGLNQGALFVAMVEEDSSTSLKLASCYAYGRKKHLAIKIGEGSGLAGQCFLERQEIYVTNVPANYTKITSGLGEATPSCIFIVPVKNQEDVVGVIELASFKPLQQFEKRFINRAAENIAAAIISSQTTNKIQKLLSDSQQQAEELRSQEEEMRQNIEELAATQEEMRRKTIETENRMNAIEQSGIASIEFNLDGTILNANSHFLNLMGYSIEEIRGQHHRMFVDRESAHSNEYLDFWQDLRNGIPRPGEYRRVNKSGQDVYIKGSYSIIRDQHGNPTRILKLATDITSLKKQQAEIQRSQVELQNTMAAINESLAVIQFKPDGSILDANDNFLQLMGYTLSEIRGKHHRIFVDLKERSSQQYLDFWSALGRGQTMKGEFCRVDKSGSKKWIRGNYSPIYDGKGNVERVIKVAYDISSYKNASELEVSTK